MPTTAFKSLLVAPLMIFPPLSLHADTVKLGGSGAGLGLLQVLGAEFVKMNPTIRVEVVPSLGSAGGIAAVAAGAISIGISGRALNSKESSLAIMATPFVESPFVFVTSRRAPTALDRGQVMKIFAGEMTSWTDGSPLRVVLRPKADAATLFVHERFPGSEQALEKLRARPDIPIAPTDQDNVDMAMRFEGSFAGMTYVQFNTELHGLRIIELDGMTPEKSKSSGVPYTSMYKLFLIEPKATSSEASKFRAFLATNQALELIRKHGGERLSMQAAVN